MSNGTSETDALKKDIESIKRELSALADNVRQVAEQRSQGGMDSARHKYEELRGQANRRTQEVGAEIESRPFTSVFAAFGIGLLLGLLSKLISR
jgi:ElaB/YqjD/DUF883 family membrane-anchored ribosome-binding protein